MELLEVFLENKEMEGNFFFSLLLFPSSFFFFSLSSFFLLSAFKKFLYSFLLRFATFRGPLNCKIVMWWKLGPGADRSMFQTDGSPGTLSKVVIKDALWTSSILWGRQNAQELKEKKKKRVCREMELKWLTLSSQLRKITG